MPPDHEDADEPRHKKDSKWKSSEDACYKVKDEPKDPPASPSTSKKKKNKNKRSQPTAPVAADKAVPREVPEPAEVPVPGPPEVPVPSEVPVPGAPAHSEESVASQSLPQDLSLEQQVELKGLMEQIRKLEAEAARWGFVL